MRRLIAKHPNGLDGFEGDLTPTVVGTGEDHVLEARL
jgi:hypothetical protein